MNTTELLTVVRRNCYLEDTASDYSDAVLLSELYDALTTKFERAVLDAKANYWIQPYVITLTSGMDNYRLPSRAVGISKVEISNGNSPNSQGWLRMARVNEDDANLVQSPVTSLGRPTWYVLRGDLITLYPTPDNSGYQLRIWYYLKPSRLVPPQASAGVGRIFAIVGTTITYETSGNVVSYARDGTTTNIGVGSAVDIVAPGMWREAKVVGATLTSSSTSGCGFSSAVDVSDVQVGDLVRPADQLEFPQIPEDFHRTLCNIASVIILNQRDFQQKAAGYAQDASQDMSRFAMIVQTRVQEDPPVLRADSPSLRLSGYWGGYRF